MACLPEVLKDSLLFSSQLAVSDISRASGGASPHTLHVLGFSPHGTIVMSIAFKAYRHQQRRDFQPAWL